MDKLFELTLVVLRNELREVIDLHKRTESFLDEELQAFKSRTDAENARTTEKHDYYYDLQHERYVQLVDSFPSLLRQGLLLTLVSTLEHHLDAVCNDLAIERSLALLPKDLSDKGIKRSRTYIKKVCGLDFPDNEKEWTELLFIADVRNRFAHAGGLCGDELRPRVGAHPHLRLSSLDEIRLEADFISFTVGVIGVFSQKLEHTLRREKGELTVGDTLHR